MKVRAKWFRNVGARSLPCVLLAAGAVAGCIGNGPDSSATNTEQSDAAGAPPATDRWLGRWTGPEGTYLDIAGTAGAYEITIQDLDRARMFAGSARGDHIEFQRDGTLEFLTATSGDETGMKWLAGKANCLTVKRGEGYCRD
jgi:hypothetical protein